MQPANLIARIFMQTVLQVVHVSKKMWRILLEQWKFEENVENIAKLG